jgi:hypothetical protein
VTSLYDDLARKLGQDPRVSSKSVAKSDLTLLLFNARDSVNGLWEAADEALGAERDSSVPATARLAAAVEALRPIFGDREDR